jgi:hypothetical protein
MQVVMMAALLFCVFLCPHSADAIHGEYSISESGLECLDLCDRHDHGHHRECEIDASHSHEFRDDTSSISLLKVYCVSWTYVLLSLEEPKHSVCYPDIMAGISSHSFAVRQLDTIILRV